MKNNPHIQTVAIMAIIAGIGMILYFIPIVGIFMAVFLLIYAIIYSDIVEQQRENDV